MQKLDMLKKLFLVMFFKCGKKSRIRETPNLLTDADSITDFVSPWLCQRG